MAIFIIRDYKPSFYTFELLFSLCTLLACLRLWRRHENKTSLIVLLAGSLAWWIIETLLYLLGTRSNGESGEGLVDVFSLFGVPVNGVAGGLLAALTRGVAEGGVITILGLLPVDLYRGRHKHARNDGVLWGLNFAAFAFYFATTLASVRKDKEVGASVDSRRALFKTGSIVATATFVLLPLVQIAISANHPLFRRRTLDLLLSLSILGVVTNYQMFFCNVRWVEARDDEEDGYVRAPAALEQLMLMYDGVVEIGLMYLPFYTVPWAMGLIDDDTISGDDGGEPLLSTCD